MYFIHGQRTVLLMVASFKSQHEYLFTYWQEILQNITSSHPLAISYQPFWHKCLCIHVGPLDNTSDLEFHGQKLFQLTLEFVDQTRNSWIHSNLFNFTHVGNQSACDIKDVSSVNMDAWKYRMSATCDIMDQHKVNFAMMITCCVVHAQHGVWTLW